jgi:cob(I)alamin adenosyltransferase
MPRLTKISTKKGDEGMTSLGGGQRVPKVSLRVRANGAVDELNSQIGLALAHGLSDRLTTALTQIQSELFHLGGDLSFPEEAKRKFTIPQIEDRHVEALTVLVEELTAVVGPLQNFILPGGSVGAAQLQLARTVCRRAERRVTALSHEEPMNPLVLAYLNRLSDVLFVMARYENHEGGVPEPLWDTNA